MKHSNQLMTAQLLSILVTFGAATANATHPIGHPGPQPFPLPSQQILSADGKTTVVTTPEGQHAAQDPFANPPGSNHLETVFENMRDHLGNEMPNTLPSTPNNPYNLHDDPVVTSINKTSQTDDLERIFKTLKSQVKRGRRPTVDYNLVQSGLDILEGNPISDRAYSGFPLLHYNGPLKAKKVEPIFDADGVLIGGNVNVHQIWSGGNIESDTSCIDPKEVWDVPWTVTYTVDTLNNGHEDFAPFVTYFQHPDHPTPNNLPIRLPHIGMDQTFFPMEDGTRTKFVMNMSKGMYFNLTYHWGWRQHPPRVQVQENCLKVIAGKSIPQWENDVFGDNPLESEETKIAAIEKIGDLAPAKRMWRAFRKMQSANTRRGTRVHRFRRALAKAERAFIQWQDRATLPDGVNIDPSSTVTLLQVNNTMYGRMTNLGPGKQNRNPDWSYPDNQAELPNWTIRPFQLKVHIINGDYFQHGYTAADFGGSRGWENTFQSTIAVGGAGPFFTFGRAHWWMPAGAPIARNANNEIVPGFIAIPPAIRPRNGNMLNRRHQLRRGIKLGVHDVHINYNHEPSRRLKTYQFDPTHHDVSIWSMH
ncbi:MAG: hypothetical protein V3V22_09925 [Methylococcales bacterium]